MDNENSFEIKMEVAIPVLRVVTKSFSTLKIMRQWQKRHDLDSMLWCLGYKEYMCNNGQWERFTVYGKKIVALSELREKVKELESEDFNSSKLTK
jgi:hypothetical protein